MSRISSNFFKIKFIFFEAETFIFLLISINYIRLTDFKIQKKFILKLLNNALLKNFISGYLIKRRDIYEIFKSKKYRVPLSDSVFTC